MTDDPNDHPPNDHPPSDHPPVDGGFTPPLPPLPDGILNSGDDANFKPWEQRPAPGMSSGGGYGGALSPAEAQRQAATDTALAVKLAQAGERLENYQFDFVVDNQAQVAHYALFNRHTTPAAGPQREGGDNADLWRDFHEEKLYDTRRVVLHHFHLFEWFPQSPGRFHTFEARDLRRQANDMLTLTADGHTYYSPPGKAAMIRGGIGAVRLRPRIVGGEPHYFMSASSNGVCHEGFPVLVPRRFYGPLKARINADGAVPVTLSGEMRYLDGDLPAFFASRRDLLGCYLHVDNLQVLPAPRAGVTQFSVSVAVAFSGTFQGQAGDYMTYCTFDPARRDDLQRTVEWISQFYVAGQHQGQVLTDFDETRAHFPGAVFGLAGLLDSQLNRPRVEQVLAQRGYNPQAGQPLVVLLQTVNRTINTEGGPYIEGNVNITNGNFNP